MPRDPASFKTNLGFQLRCAIREAYLPGECLKVVLMALVLRWPNIEATGEELEIDTGVGRRAVVRALAKLIALGLVVRMARKGRGGANRYELVLGAILALDRRKVCPTLSPRISNSPLPDFESQDLNLEGDFESQDLKVVESQDLNLSL